jgi:DNA-binding NtrC family response regulator
MADGGTIFLDEVGDLHEASQAKLLRILQDGELQRVGGEQPIRVSVRVISATNRRLDELVSTGAFREDLFYRLSVVPIRVPALRERVEDIGDLAAYFLTEFCARNTLRPRTLDPDVVPVLQEYAWPGNVRELRNVVQRAFILAPNDIGVDALPLGVIEERLGTTLSIRVGTPIDEAERRLILATLEHCAGDKKRAAEVLKISLKTLYNRLNVYNA